MTSEHNDQYDALVTAALEAAEKYNALILEFENQMFIGFDHMNESERQTGIFGQALDSSAYFNAPLTSFLRVDKTAPGSSVKIVNVWHNEAVFADALAYEKSVQNATWEQRKAKRVAAMARRAEARAKHAEAVTAAIAAGNCGPIPILPTMGFTEISSCDDDYKEECLKTNYLYDKEKNAKKYLSPDSASGSEPDDELGLCAPRGYNLPITDNPDHFGMLSTLHPDYMPPADGPSEEWLQRREKQQELQKKYLFQQLKERQQPPQRVKLDPFQKPHDLINLFSIVPNMPLYEAQKTWQNICTEHVQALHQAKLNLEHALQAVEHFKAQHDQTEEDQKEEDSKAQQDRKEEDSKAQQDRKEEDSNNDDNNTK